MSARLAALAGLALTAAALGAALGGCATPQLTDAQPGMSGADLLGANGLLVGKNYPGPIPRATLDQRIRGMVRVEVQTNGARSLATGLAGLVLGTIPGPQPPVQRTAERMLAAAPGTIIGSGFFVRAGGYIVTNQHVIDTPGEVLVRTWDGRVFHAERLGSDADLDLAVLKMDAQNAAAYPVLPLSDAGEPHPGDYALALGFPFGFDLSLAQGIVAGSGRGIGLRADDWMLQTDADINPGNSGGPLLDATGQVMGVIDAAYLWGSKAGFAEPVDLLAAHLDTLALGYTPEHGRLPFTGSSVDFQRMQVEHLAAFNCVKVETVAAAGRAAGLQPGDLIVAADQLMVHSLRDLSHALRLKEPGDRMQLTVSRSRGIGAAEMLTCTVPVLGADD